MILDEKYDWEELKRTVKNSLARDRSGHDYAHTMRVLDNCMHMAPRDVDYNILVAACLLHDIHFDPKKPKTHHITSARKAVPILKRCGFEDANILKIVHAIINHNRGFAAKKEGASRLSTEAKILCDADRIDSLGAIGIIRMIEFSNRQGVPYYIEHNSLDKSLYGNIEYMANLADDMLTPQGKKLANGRAKIMKEFLKQLKKEC